MGVGARDFKRFIKQIVEESKTSLTVEQVQAELVRRFNINMTCSEILGYLSTLVHENELQTEQAYCVLR